MVWFPPALVPSRSGSHPFWSPLWFPPLVALTHSGFHPVFFPPPMISSPLVPSHSGSGLSGPASGSCPLWLPAFFGSYSSEPLWFPPLLPLAPLVPAPLWLPPALCMSREAQHGLCHNCTEAWFPQQRAASLPPLCAAAASTESTGNCVAVPSRSLGPFTKGASRQVRHMRRITLSVSEVILYSPHPRFFLNAKQQGQIGKTAGCCSKGVVSIATPVRGDHSPCYFGTHHVTHLV